MVPARPGLGLPTGASLHKSGGRKQFIRAAAEFLILDNCRVAELHEPRHTHLCSRSLQSGLCDGTNRWLINFMSHPCGFIQRRC